MPKRRPSKHLRPPRPLLSGHSTAETKSDGRWILRHLPAGHSEKQYTCPGCLRPIAIGDAHVVAWPHEPSLGNDSPVAERRHWHHGCWKRKR